MNLSNWVKQKPKPDTETCFVSFKVFDFHTLQENLFRGD